MRLEEMTEAYIAFRQSIGEKFLTNAIVLRSFVRHAGASAYPKELTVKTCSDFIYAPNGRLTANSRIKYGALKGMFEWAVVRGLMGDMPLPVDKPRRLEYIVPYIYSKEELRRIFDATLAYQVKRNGSKACPECVQAVLKITYFLGLRISETMGLRISDLHMDESYAYIHKSKFYKSRLVPFNAQVHKMIDAFLRWRIKQGWPCDGETYLFLNKDHTRMQTPRLRCIFKCIRGVAGISRNDGAAFQPRLHDLRHSFAVHRLNSWYKQGVDVQKALPKLSTYLGHRNLANTSMYLTMTDDLLSEANALFENYKNIKKTRL